MICNSCKKDLPFNDEYFPKNKAAKNGLEKTCKECRKHKRLERSFPVIYEIKCIPTNTYYIGQTIKPLNDRISKHFSDAKSGRKQPLYEDIRNLNFDKSLFEYKELERLKDRKLLDKRERYWISKYQESGFILYNRELGGKKKCIVIKETKELMSKAKGTKPFIVYDFINNMIVGKYKTISEANNDLNITIIGSVLNNTYDHVKNYIAFYEDEYSEELIHDKVNKLMNSVKIYPDGRIRKIGGRKGEKNPMYGKNGGLNPNSKKVYVVKDDKILYYMDSCTELENRLGISDIRNYARGTCDHYYKKLDLYFYYENNLPKNIIKQ